jgi:methionine salvage enolase-phosphatase E1
VNQQRLEEALKACKRKGLENEQKISKLEKKVEEFQAMLQVEKYKLRSVDLKSLQGVMWKSHTKNMKFKR